MNKDREIRFRAWDGKQFHYWGLELKGEGTFTGSPSPAYIDTQFTGFVCSNGDEVYEGDIVYIAGTGNCKVEFDNCGYWAFGKDRVDYQDVIGDLERVIGNVFKNKQYR